MPQKIWILFWLSLFSLSAECGQVVGYLAYGPIYHFTPDNECVKYSTSSGSRAVYFTNSCDNPVEIRWCNDKTGTPCGQAISNSINVKANSSERISGYVPEYGEPNWGACRYKDEGDNRFGFYGGLFYDKGNFRCSRSSAFLPPPTHSGAPIPEFPATCVAKDVVCPGQDKECTKELKRYPVCK